MPLPSPAVLSPPRKRFSREEVERLLDSGFFEWQRCELIDGDLIDKSGQSPLHAWTIHELTVLLADVFGIELLSAQLPIEAGASDRRYSEPEPDVAVLTEHKLEYGQRHPRGDELILAIEVADSTVAFDLSRKAELYANAAVPEYWVVDLNRRLVVVHRGPGDGLYRSTLLFSKGESIPLPSRSVSIPVDDIFPSA